MKQSKKPIYSNVKLIFFGTEDFSSVSLAALLEHGFNIQAVITKPDSRGGRGLNSTKPRVKQLAEQNQIQVFQPDKLSDIAADIQVLKPDYGILVSYGKIIPQQIIDIFPGGIINLHPSLLPKYRGPSPIEAAILNGDRSTGISLMSLSAGMDEGPVYEQHEITLHGNEYKPQLYDKLAKIGAKFLCDKLPGIFNGNILAKPQDDAKAIYTKLLTKSDGIINWNKPAIEIEREIRAFIGFPKSSATIFNYPVIITKSRVAQYIGDGALVLECKNSYLEILELLAPSGRKISGADFIRGYKK